MYWICLFIKFFHSAGFIIFQYNFPQSPSKSCSRDIPVERSTVGMLATSATNSYSTYQYISRCLWSLILYLWDKLYIAIQYTVLPLQFTALINPQSCNSHNWDRHIVIISYSRVHASLDCSGVSLPSVSYPARIGQYSHPLRHGFRKNLSCVQSIAKY